MLRHKFYTWRCERRYGISTGGFIHPGELGVTNSDATSYVALQYEYLHWGLAAIPFTPSDVVFLDYGAGKGRAMAVAAAQPFRRVIGVEISEALAATARRNLARMRGRRAGLVEMHVADAASFPVPDDANVFFLFNPFTGATLAEVTRRMHQSWCAHPRDLFVIFFNHREFDERIADEPWLRKIHETAFCGFYSTTS